VKECDAKNVTFLLKRKTNETYAPLVDREFVFNFRYYEPVHNGMTNRPSGLYVFKTLENDSIPFDHKLISV
jgi:hypothetical protein